MILASITCVNNVLRQCTVHPWFYLYVLVMPKLVAELGDVIIRSGLVAIIFPQLVQTSQ